MAARFETGVATLCLMSNFWYFFRYLLKYRSRLAVATFCAVFAAALFGTALGLTLPAIKTVFQDPTAENSMTLAEYVTQLNEGKYGNVIPDSFVSVLPAGYIPGVICLVSVIVVLIVVSSFVRMAHNYTAAVLCIRAGRDIRVDLFKNLVSLPLMTLMDQPVTERVGRVMRDTHQLMKGYMNLLGRTMGDLLTGLAALIVAVYQEPMVSLVALGLAPILGWYYRRHGKLVRRSGRRVLKQWSVVLGTIVESLQGMRVVKVHHAERFEVIRFRKVNQAYAKVEYPLRWRKSVASPTIQILVMIGFAVIAVLSAYRIESGASDPTNVIAALLSLLMVAQRLRPLTMVYSEVSEASAAGERLIEILDMVPEQVDQESVQKLPRLRKEIKFKNVTFKYPTADSRTLKGINLTIQQGQTVAFVGPNGCGKTTLLSLVPRLIDPTSGTIKIDGHDLTTVRLSSLRKQMAVVTQDTVLFQGSIANNIGYGIDDPSQEQIEEAARHAHAEEFILRKPDGYDSDVGERGMSLSGGERQRVAIARAIMRDPAILILDEATSMIDAETEAQITEALSTFCKERTSLVIAHRLSTVVEADVIVVINRGRVADKGTHAELMQRCELYQQLCRTQLVNEDGASDSSDDSRSPATMVDDSEHANTANTNEETQESGAKDEFDALSSQARIEREAMNTSGSDDDDLLG